MFPGFSKSTMYGAWADAYIAAGGGSVHTQQWRMLLGETEE